jgi:hypothetical protein
MGVMGGMGIMGAMGAMGMMGMMGVMRIYHDFYFLPAKIIIFFSECITFSVFIFRQSKKYLCVRLTAGFRYGLAPLCQMVFTPSQRS